MVSCRHALPQPQAGQHARQQRAAPYAGSRRRGVEPVDREHLLGPGQEHRSHHVRPATRRTRRSAPPPRAGRARAAATPGDRAVAAAAARRAAHPGPGRCRRPPGCRVHAGPAPRPRGAARSPASRSRWITSLPPTTTTATSGRTSAGSRSSWQASCHVSAPTSAAQTSRTDRSAARASPLGQPHPQGLPAPVGPQPGRDGVAEHEQRQRASARALVGPVHREAGLPERLADRVRARSGPGPASRCQAPTDPRRPRRSRARRRPDAGPPLMRRDGAARARPGRTGGRSGR